MGNTDSTQPLPTSNKSTIKSTTKTTNFVQSSKPTIEQQPINRPIAQIIPYSFREKVYHTLYGDLILVHDLQKNKTMALADTFSTQEQQLQARIETVNSIKDLKHPHLLEIGVVPLNQAEIFMNYFKLNQIFEYHSLDLHTDFKWRKLNGKDFFTEADISDLLQQIVSALAFLQSNGVVHGGVNMYSIVVDTTQNKRIYKILPPFGLKGQDNFQQVIQMGPLAKGIFLSPVELSKLKEKRLVGITVPSINSHKADVWALGCIILGLLRNSSSDNLFDYIKFELETEGLEMSLKGLKEHVQKTWLINTLRWMLEKDDERRCGFIELEKLIKTSSENYRDASLINKENEEIRTHFSQKPANVQISSKNNVEEVFPGDIAARVQSRMESPENQKKSGLVQSNADIILIESQKKSLMKSEIHKEPGFNEEKRPLEGSSFIRPQVLKILQDFENQRGEYMSPHQENPVIILEKYNDGSFYSGEKLNGFKHGKGKYQFSDGAVYEGNFENDQISGFGTLYFPNKCLGYIGMWKNGKFHGKGSLYNKNPGFLRNFDPQDFSKLGNGWNKYEGEFEEGAREGRGMLYLMNGDIFEGDFRRDVVHGRGVIRTEEGGIFFGEWNYGIMTKIMRGI